MLKLSAAHVDRLDLALAISTEMSLRRKELPSDVAEWALKDHEDAFSDHLSARCLSGHDVETAEIVWASKGRLRFRPISALSVANRCLYRALVTDAVSLSEDAVAPYPDFSDFERAPLEEDSTKYVAFADITAFYQYVDHGLVESRLVDSTAMPDAAEAIRLFLDAVFGREFGLPQGPGSSDFLADVVLAPIERTLRRAGYFVARYSDDFRIGLSNRGAASEALELLAGELMRFGLTLNEEKSYVLHRNVYEERVGMIDEGVRTLFDRLHSRVEATPYGLRGTSSFEGMQSVEAEDEIGSALERLTDARRARDATQRVIDRRVALLGLPRLAAWKSLRGLENASSVLAIDPSFARPYGRHLRVLARQLDEPTAVQESLERIVARLGLHAGPWQKAWLLEPLLEGRLVLSPDLEAWATTLLLPRVPDVLKARAMQVLAIKGHISVQDVLEKLASFNSAAHPDLLAAAALVPDQSQADSQLLQDVGKDDVILLWVSQAITSTGGDRSWL